MKTIIKANRAIASVKAKPKILNLNNVCSREGLRDTARIRALKTFPIPIPTPAKLIVASPAPKSLIPSIIKFI